MKNKRFKWAFLLSFVLVFLSQVKAQEVSYKPTKESIEQHPTPSWFQEAKVGVFIHYSPSWYEMAMPDLFSADQWIDLFEKAGAEYFVFTTKHRDGWCNWPSKVSKHSASEKNGPRDLVSPLVESARKAGMKVGLYYNLMNSFEGVNTDIAKNPELEPSEEYVLDFMHPLMQELVSTYQPDLVWTDGDWISTSDYWHSNEIVAWLYNWAEKERREICLTDRWGRDVRICTTKETPEKYGDFWTLERRIMKDVVTTHPWESCITPTESWTYLEKEKFRIPVSELIGVMCDIVSKGGKFLINVAPAPDGSMTKADRETLLGISKWLEVNGEAIYGSKPMDCAQENAAENQLDRAKELLLPKTGINVFQNVWEQMLVSNRDQGPLRFTAKEPYIYAMHQGWPGEELELHDLAIKPGSEIRMLGVEEPLLWKLQGNKITVKLPAEKPCEHAFVLKMEKGEANTVDYVTQKEGKVDFGKTAMSAYTPKIRANMKQLYKDKFGLFVHFGPYAQLHGVWDGKEIAAEWIMRRGFIPVKEYEKHAAGLFKPEKFNAIQWVDIAESAGMKLIVVTAKHHDGFAMYDSAHPYNLVDFAGFGRDILKELSVECAKRDMNLGFYYSQSQDWHEEGGVGNHWDFEGVTKPQEQFDAYFADKAVMQVKELTSNYGDIFMIWFDTPAQMDDQKCQQMMDIVRENQPSALVNSRLGQGYGHFDVSIDNGKTPSVCTSAWLSDLKIPWQTHESVTQRGWGYPPMVAKTTAPPSTLISSIVYVESSATVVFTC